jgi:hypothetical protein
MAMRIFTTVILATLLGASPSAAQSKKQLTEAEAIRIAEQFVVENGYTDLPPVQDKTKLSYESIDSSDPDQRLKDRFNTLERKAYGVGRGRTKRYNRWTIVFRYNAKNDSYRRVIPNYEQRIKKIGRAVTMDADGSNIRMQH